VQIAEKVAPKFSPKLSKLSLLMFQQQNKGSFLERMERDALKKVRHTETLYAPVYDDMYEGLNRPPYIQGLDSTPSLFPNPKIHLPLNLDLNLNMNLDLDVNL
jgi:hypothetical protein